MIQNTKYLIVTIVSASAFFGSYVLSTTRPSEFKHQEHLASGAECDTCHTSDNDEKAPTLNRRACVDCHDTVPYYRFNGGRTTLSIQFQHKKHADAFPCQDCHKKVIKDPRKKISSMSHKQCVICHRESGVEISPQNCRSCHGLTKKQIKPKTHGNDIITRHGRQAKWKLSTGHAGDCYTCHRKTKCTECHQTRRPRDHNGLWKVRMHGISATWNRDRCRNCHQSATCIGCHQRTKPFSHKGLWQSLHGRKVKSRSDSRCGVCHKPAWCAKCHMEK